jgi:translocation and assembly module TamB
LTEPKAPQPAPNETPVSAAPKLRRLRRFFLRHLPLTVLSLLILLSVTLAGLYFWASSKNFENLVRQRLIDGIEEATGARVEIGSFHWNLNSLELEADGIVLHGLEAPDEEPYAKIDSLRVRLSWMGLWSPRFFVLRELDLVRPTFHLIVYPDGSTNQPTPRKAQKKGSSALDSLFDLRAGRLEVEQGAIDYDNRAAVFDFQNRHIPLDFTANDLSLRMSYQHARGKDPESFHIDAGVSDLNLLRGGPAEPAGKNALQKPQLVQGRLQATIDLMRNAAILRSLRLTAENKIVKEQTLDISGSLTDFSHPRWQATSAGLLDMRLLDAITGYPFAPQGLAKLDLNGAGEAGQFRVDGTVHVENGAYIGAGVYAPGIGLDARIHADAQQLLITSIVARLREGGQIEGSVALDHWLPPSSNSTRFSPAQLRAAIGGHLRGAPSQDRSLPPLKPGEIEIPVDGKVTAQFRNVALDTILEMVAQPPFQHLGFDSRVNGPAVAIWNGGDVRTLAVTSRLTLTAPGQVAAGKIPASGLIDGTYTQRDGAVDLRSLDLQLPTSHLQAHGHLGAYPLKSPSALSVDLQTGNFAEFDTVLRDLGLARNGKTGAAALPAALAGQAEFHGTWTGSLSDPKLTGTAQATHLSIELPPIPGNAPSQPKSLAWDSVSATGSYSAAHIAIDHADLIRGKAAVSVSGTLDAAPARVPQFDANARAHLRLSASKADLDELLPLAGLKLPITGSLDAQLQIDGPLHSLGANGWLDVSKASVYGEPFERIHAHGSLANQLLDLTSLTAISDAGKLSATGSYDLRSRSFHLQASGVGVDLSSLNRIDQLRKQGLPITGKLTFTVNGAGTLDDPRLEAHASVADLHVGDQSVGSLELTAHTANRAVIYDLTTQLNSAQLNAHGQTALSGDFLTQAQVDFSRFNIGALFKLAPVPGLSGDSSLAGTVTIDGPLAHPAQMHGDLRLKEMALTVSGLPLHSDGGLHATLANGRIQLDPLHIVGELTDMRAQGSITLEEHPKLDFSANGAINLKLAETLDPDLTASGTTTFEVEAHGPLTNPALRGHVDIQDASLSLEDLPNGLSHLHGSLEFNQNRLEVKSLTAMSGGGQLSVTGYLAYQHGLYADLSVNGQGIRIRYPQGVSSLADAKLHLQGAQNNLLLSGDVLITRFTVSPDLDVAALTAQARAVQAFAPPDAPSNHIRLDVRIQSSPQLNFQNAFAKLAGDVDLRLRGTVASPSLLGRVTITDGSATIAGTKYELQRGEISFTNPIRIQPNIDLYATARVEDYDITLGLYGTLDKPSITYRSDPPLPEADVVALLALGRTEDQQRIYTQQQEQSGANPTDALLGGALNATVSNRVQKLFGAGSVKVDPNYLGPLGNSTSRVIVEEQLGGNVTLTYATNVNATAQQLIQAEIAINRHVSLLVARDESGVFSMVVKATRRYR